MVFRVHCLEPGVLAVVHRGKLPQPLQAQVGSMLMEAMVGLMVSAALGLGMAYSAARALKAQRYSTTQTLAVLQMRALLAVPADVNTWCTTGSGSLTMPLNNVNAGGAAVDGGGSVSTVDLALGCSVLAPTITGAGQSAAVSLKRPTSLSTVASTGTASSLFGGDGVISFGP